MAFLTVKNEQELSDMAKYGVVGAIDTTGYPDGSTIKVAAQYVTKVGEILAEFRGNVAQIRASADYTEAGKQSRFGELASVFLPRFDIFNPFLGSAQKKLDELRRTSVTTDPSEGDSAAQAIREAEIRALIPRDSLEVRLIFIEAIENGEQETYDAIRRAPRFMKLLSAKDVADGEALWANKRDPEKAKHMSDLRKAIETLKTVIANAQSAIRSDAGISASNTLEAIARGDAE